MGIHLIIAFCITTASVVLTRYLFRGLWSKQTRAVNLLKNLLLLLFTTIYFMIVLEIIFSTFFIQSDRRNFTLASRRWFQIYWNPINSDGYRDFEHKWEENIVFVVGDSFVTGHGIKDISDRFSGVLAGKLGTGWTVAVLAQEGWDPLKEYEALVNHPKKPKRIILSYFINDIDSAAQENGFNLPEMSLQQPGAFIRPFVNRSYFLNWIYWRLPLQERGFMYWDYLEHAFNDPHIWKSHERELMKFVTYARQIGSDIAFVVWPHFSDIEGSTQFTSKVVDFLEGEGVKVIDLTRYFSGRDPDSLIVNSMDPHPNVKANAEVAQLLYDALSPWK